MEVIIGYGKFENYRLEEVPDELLRELADRYRLEIGAHSNSSNTELRITIAVHEELQRRHGGGKMYARRPTQRELAARIVSKGFQILSKDHHPDRGGDEEVQKELAAVRNQLVKFCEQMPEVDEEDALVIPAPGEDADVRHITDEDIPF